jgi:hypothetical protein
MTLDESILGMRLRVMRRAHELGNVSAACTEAGISRTLFSTDGGSASSAMGRTGCIRATGRPVPAARPRLPRTSSGWCSGSRWPGPRGAVGD